MNDLSLPGFQHAIKAIHGAHSRFVKRVRVEGDLEGLRVWEGEVLVFALIDHPRTHECYVWELDGQVTAILHGDAIKSPQDAVRVAIDAFNMECASQPIADRRR